MDHDDRKINGKISVAIDLDGVIAQTGEWQGVRHIGDPIPGAVDFMQQLSRVAYIVIWTCRCKIEEIRDRDKAEGLGIIERRRIVADYLDRHGIPYDEIWNKAGKPYVSVYVDDRAVCVRPEAVYMRLENGLRKAFRRAIEEIQKMGAA